MLRIEIEARPIIPVRLIPFVTGWKFPPDSLACMLANKEGFNRIHLDSYHLEADGSHHPIVAKKWDTRLADLEILTSTLKAGEKVESEHYQVWREKSIKMLPAATFVWLDELEKVWSTIFSKKCMTRTNERQRARELNLSPLIDSSAAGIVYEGFELIISAAPRQCNGQQGVRIRFSELHHYMMLDPFYGVESVVTESIIKAIYRKNTGNQFFRDFGYRFSLLPCKADKHRHLIYLWYGLMELPAYRGDQPLGWQREKFFDHWTEDFDLRRDELKEFLRKHAWPLPSRLFSDEFDNTERKLALEEKAFTAASHNFTVVLPQLEEELVEVKAIQPESMEARQQKKAEIARIEQQIAAIYGESNPVQVPQCPTEEAQNRFALTGDHWHITFNGQTRTLNNTKGLRYIAHLIRNQGKEVLVSDLYYAINPPDTGGIDPIHSTMTEEQLNGEGLLVGDLGGAGDVLTPEGKKRLEEKLLDIQTQVKEAVAVGDEEKAEKLECLHEQILERISADTGLGGKSRKASSFIEKTRKTVTNGINRGIDKISENNPDLGHHLKETLRTGTHCQYAPHPPVKWLFKP